VDDIDTEFVVVAIVGVAEIIMAMMQARRWIVIATIAIQTIQVGSRNVAFHVSAYDIGSMECNKKSLPTYSFVIFVVFSLIS
jgi:hypothetical protein